MPGFEGFGGDQRVAEIAPGENEFSASVPMPRSAVLSWSRAWRNVANSNGFMGLSSLTISPLDALPSVACRQREWQAPRDQRLEKNRIRTVLAKRHVDDRSVDVAVSQFERPGQTVRRAGDYIAQFRQPLFEHGGDQGLIVNDQDPRHSASGCHRRLSVPQSFRRTMARSPHRGSPREMSTAGIY